MLYSNWLHFEPSKTINISACASKPTCVAFTHGGCSTSKADDAQVIDVHLSVVQVKPRGG